jgi:hypothetical protein
MEELAALTAQLARGKDIISAVTGQISQSLQVVNGLVNPIKLTTGALQTFTSVLTLPIDSINQVANSIKGLVAVANPATVERFNLAMADAAAVVGHQLEPLMNSLTASMRKVGDALVALRPVTEPIALSFKKIADTLSELVQPAAELLQPVLDATGQILTTSVLPALRLWVDGMKGLSEGIRAAWNDTGLLGQAFAVLLTTISPILGLIKLLSPTIKPLDVKPGSSQGQAYRPAQYSNIEELGRQTSLAAFSVGGGETKTQESILEDIANKSERTFLAVTDVVNKIEYWADRLWNKIPNAKDLVPDVSKLLPDTNTGIGAAVNSGLNAATGGAYGAAREGLRRLGDDWFN